MTARSETLTQYVIYDHPLDYPHHFVVRQFHIGSGTVTAGSTDLADSLENARKLIPLGLVNVGRHHEDDFAIVETWS